MSPKPAPAGYSRLQIRLHWAVVVLVALQYVLHEGVARAFDAGMETGSFTLAAPVIGHFAGGAAILLLALWRLMLRSARGVPEPPAEEPALQKAAARATHAAFYALLLALPVSGAVAWAMQSAAASTAHEVMRAALMLLILLHVAAALYGQLVKRTGVMDRMRVPAD